MPQTVVELGQKVKAKYPGQYDDMSDADVGVKVKAKFPGQYDDFTDVAAQSQPAQTLMQRIESHLPSGRTVARVGGAMIGGALGGAGGTILGTPIGGVGGAAMGGAAGASIGESVYELGNRLLGSPAPQTSGEAAMNQAGALTQGALQEAVPAAMTKMLPGALQKSAQNRIAESVSPMSMGEKANVAKVAENAVQDFPVSATRSGLLTKLTDRAASANKAVDAAYAQARNSGTSFDAQPIINTLQHKMDRLMVQGQPIVGNESRVSGYQAVMDWLQNHPQFTTDEFRQVKQQWDALKNFNNGSASTAADKGMAEAVETGANTVRDAIHQVFPKIAKADKAANTWITLRDALQRAATSTVGKEALQTFIRRGSIPGAVGGAVAYADGKSPFEGATIGALLGQVTQVTQTTAWDTLSTAEKALLIRALQNPMGQAAVKGGAAVASGALEGQQ